MLISKSVIALIALKYLGALYLVYLGVMSIKSKSKLITKIVEGEPIMGVFWYSGLTVFASFFSDKIKNNPNSGILLNRVSGIVFILMAILMAI